jgi:hypothetical protein
LSQRIGNRLCTVFILWNVQEKQEPTDHLSDERPNRGTWSRSRAKQSNALKAAATRSLPKGIHLPVTDASNSGPSMTLVAAIALIWAISLFSLALTLPSDFWAQGVGDQKSRHAAVHRRER